VLETNVHFPTDLNLLWDSLRRCLDLIVNLQKISAIKGWRKIKHIRKMLKTQFRATSHQVFKGKDEYKKKQLVKQYLHEARVVEANVAELIKHPPVSIDSKKLVTAIIVELTKYKNHVTKFTDQVERRLLKGEVIPAEEKIFSIFEEHTEWITKGKLNKKVEPGHLILITTDQYQFIADYKVMEKQRDGNPVVVMDAGIATQDNLEMIGLKDTTTCV
jgi:IS5 family transposase